MKANNYQFTNENDLINLLSKLNNEKNYYNVYSSLENIFRENGKMFQKETNEIFTIKINDFIINGNNHYIKLAWFMLVENKVDIIPTIMIEKCFVDNSIISKMIIDVINEIYRSKNDNDNGNEEKDFQLPSTKYFINLIFKLPVIITNYFEFSFINHSHFYECLFKNILLFRIDLLEDNNFISKIFLLKLFEILYKCITNNSFDESIQISLMEIIQRNELFKEEFIKRLFHFHSIVNKSQFIQISHLYKPINSFNCLNKIDKIIKKNNFFLTLVLISQNKQLQNNCFSSIIKIMKNQTRSLFEDIEIYDFYIVFFFIYYILETCDDLEMLDVFDGLVKICFIVLENVSDKNKKGIVQIFMNYLYQQMHQYLKSKNSKSELQEIEIDEVYNKEQINILNFQNTRKLFDNDSFSLNSSINENDFKIKFYSIIIKTPYSIIQKQLLLKQINNKEENQKQLPNKQNKVTYKSIKFQKKYGTFEKKKYLEIKENKNNSILNITGNNIENKIDDDEKITLSFESLLGKNKLKISLNKNDDYNDLKKMKPPEHIKDCILGLNSQFKDRQELSLKVLPSLIESQPLDLDFHLKDLANSLLRIENNFDIEEFESLLKLSLVNLTKFNPSKLTLILCERFFSNDNCGLKNKFFILDIINKAVEEISQYYDKTPNNKKNKKGRANVFHPYFLNVIFPLLNYLKIQKIEFLITFDTFDLLLAKFLFIIVNILKVSENHPVVYKALFETFELFKAITKVKILINCKSHSLLEAMNAYIDVSLDFYKENFIMVYPDILENYKNAIKYLNNLLDTKELNEDLRLRILQTLHKYTIQVNKFKESYFGISQDKNDVVDSIGVKFASQLLV